MDERFAFDDPFYPLPPAAVDAEPPAAIRALLYRVSRLEQALEEQRAEARNDLAEALLEIIGLHDDVTNIIERWGVTTRAQEAAIAGSVLALGKKLISMLKHHQVFAVEVLGAPLDVTTSDVVGSEPRDDVPSNTVLRELLAGYTWPHGLLRRAQVLVSMRSAEAGRAEGQAPGSDR